MDTNTRDRKTHEPATFLEKRLTSCSPHRLIIAISSRALFDLDASHDVYQRRGVEAYSAHQIEQEDVPLNPGPAFALVRKLLALNTQDAKQQRVEVVLVSRNSADTGLRIMNSISHHKLDIPRAVFSGGGDALPYLEALAADLFLSVDPADVWTALAHGHAAATILPAKAGNGNSTVLRIAFDGDAVLFSDASERIFKTEGLAAFTENERVLAATPMLGGPFKEFLAALHRLQVDYPAETAPIRTALVTARAAPAHERVIRTLRAWNIRIDEAIFLGGRSKGPFLKAFGADIFFDDQPMHCESAREHVTTGHVPHGVANESTPGASADACNDALLFAAGAAQNEAVTRACAVLDVYPSAAERDRQFAIVQAQLSDASGATSADDAGAAKGID